MWENSSVKLNMEMLEFVWTSWYMGLRLVELEQSETWRRVLVPPIYMYFMIFSFEVGRQDSELKTEILVPGTPVGLSLKGEVLQLYIGFSICNHREYTAGIGTRWKHSKTFIVAILWQSYIENWVLVWLL